MGSLIAMVQRLMQQGMSLKHSVNLVCGAYAVDPNELYKQLYKKGVK